MTDMDNSRDNVGMGWQPIIDKLSAALALLDPHYETTQVKEKFGGLRYYIRPSDKAREDETIMWALSALTDAAEAESLRTCERCGKRGTVHVVGVWRKTLCSTHAAEAWGAWAERQKELKT